MSRGRAVFVALNTERRFDPPGDQYWGRWPAVAIWADGACERDLENSAQVDDWPEGFSTGIPGPGVWLWDGTVEGGELVSYGENGSEVSDVRIAGDFRRLTAAEAFRVMHGNDPLRSEPVAVECMSVAPAPPMPDSVTLPSQMTVPPCLHGFIRYTLDGSDESHRQRDGLDKDGRPYRDVPMEPPQLVAYARMIGSTIARRIVDVACAKCGEKRDMP